MEKMNSATKQFLTCWFFMYGTGEGNYPERGTGYTIRKLFDSDEVPAMSRMVAYGWLTEIVRASTFKLTPEGLAIITEDVHAE